MTYEQFWEMDCELVKYYRKAAKIKQDLDNQQAWLQGAYFYEALADVSPILHAFAKKGTNPIPYRDSPYQVSESSNSAEKKAKEQKNDSRGYGIKEISMIANNKKFEPGGEKHGRAHHTAL